MLKDNPLGRRLALASLVLFAPACGDASECSLAMPLSGDIQGTIAFESTGENACSYDPEYSPGIFLMSVYMSERPPGFNGVEGIDLVVQGQGLAVGVFPANVTVPEGTRTFISSDYTCSLNVLSYERENWTVTDYIRFAAILDCPDPLGMLGGGSAEIMLQSTQIEGYVLDGE